MNINKLKNNYNQNMKRFNILYGKEIPLNEKENNSFFLYHTIYTNESYENNNPISFCNNSYFTAVLYLINSDYLLLEIYKNTIDTKNQEIHFNITRKIKVNPASLEYTKTSSETIQMFFLGENYILIENIFKKSIILDHQTGDYTSILLKGKKTQRKNIVYNPAQNSCDDLFKDDSLNSDKSDNNKNLGNLNAANKNKNNGNNDSSESINMDDDNLNDENNASNLNDIFNTLKILYVFDEYYQQIIIEKPDKIINQNQNYLNNKLNIGATINNETSTISNNYINTNITNSPINPSPNNISNNNSFILNKKFNQNVNKIQNQNHINNNLNINTDNLESITSNDISGNDTKKNTIANITNNYTTMNTNMVTTLPNSNQNTIDEIKILFNTKQNNTKKITLKRSYIFLMDKNQLYYCIIDNKFDLNQILEFKQVAFSLDETEMIDQMEIIKVKKDDKNCYIIFLLSKTGLFIIPTDFCRSTLKNLILNNGFNRANNYKLFYKLDFNQDPLNCYHMKLNYQFPQNASVYILNKYNLITINLNLFNLKNFIKEELFKLNTKQQENYELGLEEKIELENNNTAIVNKVKRMISFNKPNFDNKKLKIMGYITNVEYMDGNFILYDKMSKTLAIYYFNGEFVDKVENYKDVDLIFFFTFNKIYSVFFCMNNTFNKVSFNKKLYWYSQYFSTFTANVGKKSFIFPSLKNYIHEIKEKYNNGIFIQSDKEIIISKESKINKRNRTKNSIVKRRCEFCRKEIMVDLNKLDENNNNETKTEEKEPAFFKCQNKNCQTVYCCEIHRDIDFKSFHFFHCKLKQFFINYRFWTQMNFYNDLILLINDLIKYIFNNIKYLDDYLFFLPFIKMAIFILKSFNIRVISDRVIELSQKLNISKEDTTSLLFYQEVIFYYYNLILLSLNFGQKYNLHDFVKKELDFLSDDEEQFFNKNSLLCTLFKRNFHFYQPYVNFSRSTHYFFIDENYLITSNYLRQNDILFSHVIHLYANYLHLTDKSSRENQLDLAYFNPFNIKLLSQLTVFFKERNKESSDDTYTHFLSLISPYFILNRKIALSTTILTKASKLMKSHEYKNNIFKIEVLHNLGLVQYSKGKFLEGIHNIEKAYQIILEKDFSYLIRIKIVERLALAYLNIRELLKSFILIKQAMELRTNLLNLYEANSNIALYKMNSIDKNDYLYKYYSIISNNISNKKINYNLLYKKKEDLNYKTKSFQRKGIFENNREYYENAIKLVHLFTYINYIQDFIEFENQSKNMQSKEKKKGIFSKRDYQIYLINYVLDEDNLFFKNRNFNIIDTYCEDYFRAIEFLYSLNKDILKKIDNDNKSKRNNLMFKEEGLGHQNPNTNNKSNNGHSSSSFFDENNLLNQNKKNNQENINNNNNINGHNNTSKEKEKNLEYDNEIEIKEDLYDKLSRNEQFTLTGINTKFFNRKNLLRDYYGSINKNNINYHPIYTEEFKNIISSSKHQYFVKILTHANSPELTNYFFPTSNNNLEGLSKYIQQEEIQNMFKVEKAKILSIIQDDSNIKKKKLKDPIIINNINDILIEQEKQEKSNQKKEQWVSNIKSQLLKDSYRSLPEIDSSLNNLYDNLNEEYKEEITKNPELILYYIFAELTSPQSSINAIQLKKNELEDDSDIMTKTPELYYKNMKGPKKEMIYKRTSFFENEEEQNSGEENKNTRKLNLYEMIGIPEEKKLVFSDNSSSSDEAGDNFNFDLDNVNDTNDNEMKEKKKN